MAQNSFMDFLQGASNSAASNLSAPIDGLNWLLRKAGLPVSEVPMGGSDWMAKQGLTAQPQNRNAGLLGEAFGGVLPIVAAAKAPQIAKGLLQGADNLAAPRTMNPETGAIVWHGSPHKFDKFDSSKIGTGEGAQAYGHGLYLAESPETASFYRDKLTSSGTILSRGDALEARSNVLRKVADRVEKSDPARAAKLRSEADTFSRDGSLYKVDLPDEHIAKMLDWDAPLSQQHPDVLSSMGYHNKPRDFEAEAKAVYGSPEYASLEKLMDTRVGSAAVPDVTGAQWYRSTDDLLRGTNADEAGRSEYLRSLGIPGIRYLDEGSRGAGQGSSNFVVFPGNEGLLSIMERNGQPIGGLLK